MAGVLDVGAHDRLMDIGGQPYRLMNYQPLRRDLLPDGLEAGALPPPRPGSFRAYFPVAALNLAMSPAGTRPRSLTSIP
jgi:hypothetical protein